MTASYRAAHLSEIPSPVEAEPGGYDWKPVRIHFGVRSFGVNAMVARRSGDQVVEEHDEMGQGAGRHEELYFVSTGHARFTVDGDELDAPAGTFVYVPDPESVRTARALADGTTVVALGGKPGEAFQVSPWEKRYMGPEVS